MKKLVFYIILLSVVCLSSACSDKEERGIEAEIGFSSAASRAAIENDFPEGSTFSVWGKARSGEGLEDVFSGTQVKKESGIWTYQDKRFWLPGRAYKFCAVHPYSSAESGNYSVSYEDTDGSFRIEGFDCSKSGATLDLMTSTAQRTTNDPLQETDTEIVKLSFRHELARVLFVAKKYSAENAGNYLSVISASLYGMYRKGNLKVTCDGGDSEWTDFTEQTDMTAPLVKIEDEVFNIEDEGTTVIEALVFPQKLDVNCGFSIVYKTSEGGEERQMIVDLPSLSVGEWIAGKQYRYSFTITPDDRILFDKPVVNKWNEATGGIIIVD